jgi:hypothetical protein
VEFGHFFAYVGRLPFMILEGCLDSNPERLTLHAGALPTWPPIPISTSGKMKKTWSSNSFLIFIVLPQEPTV